MFGAPVPSKPLILYIAAQKKSLGALYVQENEEGKEAALYYLSHTFVSTKLKHSHRKDLLVAHLCHLET